MECCKEHRVAKKQSMKGSGSDEKRCMAKNVTDQGGCKTLCCKSYRDRSLMTFVTSCNFLQKLVIVMLFA